VRTEEEKREAIYVAPPSNSHAMARVEAMLEAFVAKSYDALLAYYVEIYTAKLAGFVAARDQVIAGTYKASDGHKYTARSFSPHDYFRHGRYTDTQSATLVLSFLDLSDGNHKPLPNADEIIQTKAKEIADHIKRIYVVKNLKKIVSILEAKGDEMFEDIKEVNGKINMSYLSGSMMISFKDGSRFTATNSVVFTVNSFGTAFERFPLTFHDVLLAGGVKMARPSEKRMNTVFVGKE